MSSKIKVDTIENVAGSGNVSLGSGHNLVVPGNVTGQGTLAITGNTTMGGTAAVTGKITSTAGITFGSDTATANVLDDYEEGQWTVAITDGTNDGTLDSNSGGHYTKIGGLVFVTGHANMTSKGSLSGGLSIKTLPFVVKPSGTFFTRGGGSVGRVDNLNRAADDQAIYISFDPSSDRLNIYIDDNTNENQPLAANQIDATFRIYFSATYMTDA